MTTTTDGREFWDDILHEVPVPPEWRYLTDEETAYMWGLGFIAFTGDGEWFSKVGLDDFDLALEGYDA